MEVRHFARRQVKLPGRLRNEYARRYIVTATISATRTQLMYAMRGMGTKLTWPPARSTRPDAHAAFDRFVSIYAAKYPKATETLMTARSSALR